MWRNTAVAEFVGWLRRHNGEMARDLTSQPHRRLRNTFPRRERAVSAMTAAQSNPASILIVDDEPAIARAVQQMLQRLGHTATAATTGGAALEALRTGRFDVILTDMLMPDTDGTEIIAAARKLQPHARIVAASGGGTYVNSPDVLTLAMKLGAHAALLKPFTLAQLRSAVEGTPPGAPPAAPGPANRPE